METGMSDESLPGPRIWTCLLFKTLLGVWVLLWASILPVRWRRLWLRNAGMRSLFSLNSAPTVILMLLPTPVIALCFQLASRVSICRSCLSNGSNVSEYDVGWLLQVLDYNLAIWVYSCCNYVTKTRDKALPCGKKKVLCSMHGNWREVSV